VTAWVMLAELG